MRQERVANHTEIPKMVWKIRDPVKNTQDILYKKKRSKCCNQSSYTWKNNKYVYTIW